MENPPAISGAPAPAAAGDDAARTAGPLERLASFRFTYVAIFLFLMAYVFTVETAEEALHRHFRRAVAEATRVDPTEGPVGPAIADRVQELVDDSPWTTLGVRVRPVVLAADGHTLLYAGGRRPLEGSLEPPGGAELLPAIVDVSVSVPHNALLANGILVSYAAGLLTILYLYTRRWTRRAEERLRAEVDARDQSARRAEQIERELDDVRTRLASAEPARDRVGEEIKALEDERTRLLERLAQLEEQETSLRSEASSAHRELEEERRALEELLDEAVQDVSRRDEEIRSLQKQARRSGRDRSRDAEAIGRRLRTLYKNLEVDDRALEDLASLGDEGLRLKAEEVLKRLSDDPESAAVRRKVGGLPPHLSIFELGFAGKGRIYVTRGRSRRHRVLLVGAKNSQKPDLEYLSRLPKET